MEYYIMDSNIDKASRFLGDFAKLNRLNLDQCTRPSILLSEEIEYLKPYIRIENTRFNNAIRVEIVVNPEIDVYEAEIPSMILQTFVENVFVHVFPGNVKEPSLRLSFKRFSKDVLKCRIEDIGVRFSETSNSKLHTIPMA